MTNHERTQSLILRAWSAATEDRELDESYDFAADPEEVALYAHARAHDLNLDIVDSVVFVDAYVDRYNAAA